MVTLSGTKPSGKASMPLAALILVELQGQSGGDTIGRRRRFRLDLHGRQLDGHGLALERADRLEAQRTRKRRAAIAAAAHQQHLVAQALPGALDLRAAYIDRAFRPGRQQLLIERQLVAHAADLGLGGAQLRFQLPPRGPLDHQLAIGRVQLALGETQLRALLAHRLFPRAARQGIRSSRRHARARLVADVETGPRDAQRDA